MQNSILEQGKVVEYDHMIQFLDKLKLSRKFVPETVRSVFALKFICDPF